MFQNSEISFSEKNFPTFKCIVTSQSPGIAMRSQGQILPFACNQRKGLSLFGSHGKGLEAGCLIAIQEFQSRPKIFHVKKFSTIFQNRFSSCFRTLR